MNASVEVVPPDPAMGSFGIAPVSPPIDVDALRVAGGMLGRIVAAMKLNERRAGEVMRAVGRVLDSGEAGRFVCFSVPWTHTLIVADADGRAYPRAAAKRHKAQPVALDVDELMREAREAVRTVADGGGEGRSA